jgi:hypothetical protein
MKGSAGIAPRILKEVLSIRNRPFMLAYAVVRSVVQLLTIHAQVRPLPWRMSSFQALRRDDATWWYCRADSKTSQKTVSLLLKKLGSVQFNYADVVSSIRGPILGLAALPSLGLGAQKSSMRRHGDIQRMDFRVRSLDIPDSLENSRRYGSPPTAGWQSRVPPCAIREVCR